MAKLIEKADLAWALGVNDRTVERWGQQGCTHERDPDGATAWPTSQRPAEQAGRLGEGQ